MKPVIETPGHKRQDVEEASGFALDILAYDADEDKDGEHARLSKAFTDELLGEYLSRTRILTGEKLKLSPENEFVTQELEELLVAFGRQKPKVRAEERTRSIFRLTYAGLSAGAGPPVPPSEASSPDPQSAELLCSSATTTSPSRPGDPTHRPSRKMSPY